MFTYTYIYVYMYIHTYAERTFETIHTQHRMHARGDNKVPDWACPQSQKKITVYMYTNTYVCTYIYIYIHVYVCIFIYIFMYIFIYTYICRADL